MKLDRLRHHLGSDRCGVETPAFFKHLLVIGEVAGAVEHLEVHDRTAGNGAFFKERTETLGNSWDRKAGEGALIRQITSD